MITIAGKSFPCRQLKWREMRAIKASADADSSNKLLYELMGFGPQHLAAIDDMPVGDVHCLQRDLFAAAIAPTELAEKN